MTEANWTNLFGVILTLGLAWIGYLQFRAKIVQEANTKIQHANSDKLDVLHEISNSRYTNLEDVIKDLRVELKDITARLDFLKGQTAYLEINHPGLGPDPLHSVGVKIVSPATDREISQS